MFYTGIMIKRIIRDVRREWDYISTLDAYRDDMVQDKPEALRLYVAVRSDILPPLNQGIQAAHAVIELGANTTIPIDDVETFFTWAQQDKTLILLGANESEMVQLMSKLRKRSITFATFREPDLGDVLTAVAILPMTAKTAKDITWGLRRAE